MNQRIAKLLLVTVISGLLVGLAFMQTEAEADESYPPLPEDLSAPIPAPWPEEPGRMPDLVGGRISDRPIVYSYPSVKAANEVDAQTAGPTIDVWYGSPQPFGQIGNPQQWVNILGNIPDTNPSSTLSYKLNTDAEKPLALGGNGDRLDEEGDFNVEIDYASLNPGSNTVLIKASDGISDTQKTVTINYTSGQNWPDNYDAKWSSSSNIQDIAQVVDGYWQLDGNSAFIDANNYGYDRLLAIGDESWTDYEVTVPVTVYGLDPEGMKVGGNGAGVGFIMRWLGHTIKDAEQPNANWDRTGAIGWYRWNSDLTEGLELRGYDWRRALNFNKDLEFGTTYMFKMSVQSVADQPAYYRIKVWKASENEPIDWDNQGFSSETASTSGSLLLVAHHVDAKFGEVKVRSLDDMRFKVNVTVNGEGSIVYTPDQEDFAYSERIRVYALPEPGYDFDGWTGDFTGEANPADFRIYRDMNLTATFSAKLPVKLTTMVEGDGTISRDPDKSEYLWGEQVSLTAAPGADFVFSHWTGDLTGIQNPQALLMDADKNVTAVFIPESDETPQSDDFSQCELDEELWSVVNPAGDASLSIAANRANFTIPAGTNHDMWSNNADALRIMQPTQNKNFEVQVKFDSIPEEKFQMEGILIQEDEDNWLRFDVYHDGGNLVANAAKTLNGNSNNIKSSAIDPDGANSVYIKVERNGDKWTQSYSFDGSDWITFAVFIQVLEVSSSGVFAGNTAKSPGLEPAFVARADYFFNTAVPIIPEDEGNTIDVKVVGQGQVQVNPQKDTYNCGEKVTLTATPAPEWLFLGWSGDLLGSANPATLTIKKDYKITATFSQGVTLYLPLIVE